MKTKYSKQEFIDLYKYGFSTVEIAKIYSFSQQYVWEVLKKNNVKIRSSYKSLTFIDYAGNRIIVNENK